MRYSRNAFRPNTTDIKEIRRSYVDNSANAKTVKERTSSPALSSRSNKSTKSTKSTKSVFNREGTNFNHTCASDNKDRIVEAHMRNSNMFEQIKLKLDRTFDKNNSIRHSEQVRKHRMQLFKASKSKAQLQEMRDSMNTSHAQFANYASSVGSTSRRSISTPRKNEPKKDCSFVGIHQTLDILKP